MASLMPLLTKCESEADLSDEQFHAVARFAALPPPALPIVTADELREMIAFLAGSLKAPRTGIEAGKIKLGAYRLALADQPKAALAHAVRVAIETLEWLPTPAELLRIARTFTANERTAHARARFLVANRRQREFAHKMRQCQNRELSHAELQALTDAEAKVAQTQGSILIRPSGERVYRTAETLEADYRERMQGVQTVEERGMRADTANLGGNGGVGDEKGSEGIEVAKTAFDALGGLGGDFRACGICATEGDE